MRPTTAALIEHYTDHLHLGGDVLEIGGHRLAQCAVASFPAPRWNYHDLNIEASDIPQTIIADVTDCREQIPDDSFDLVLSSDVFEHIDRPWLAAAEIARILRPGGLAVTHTLFSWRNHPCPIDYWRYSAECLEFLFADLECLEKGYDLSERRRDQPGFWKSGADSVPVDGFGGWREHWGVYVVNRKAGGSDVSAVPQFKHTDHPLATHLRQDTQGTVTNPRMLGTDPQRASAATFDDRFAAIGARFDALERQLASLGDTVERAERSRRAAASAARPLTVRAYDRARRRIRTARVR